MLAIDHIVIAAKDPAQAAAAFGRQHGAVTVEGGRHTNWGTYNYLAYFHNDCYIEWLGIFDSSLAVQSDNPLVQQLVQALDADFEGTLQFALRTRKMNTYLKHFSVTGVDYTGPIAGSRQKPDGTTLEWRMLFPDLKTVKAPFLIEWGKEKNVPQEERLMNRQTVSAVTCGLAADILKQIYQLDSVDNVVQLENGRLELRDGGEIDIHMG